MPSGRRGRQCRSPENGRRRVSVMPPPAAHIVVPGGLSNPPQPFLAAFFAVPFFAAAFSAAGTTFAISTEPPVFSTASTAAFDAPATAKASFAVSGPLASRRKPFLPPPPSTAALRPARSSVPLGSGHFVSRALLARP